MRQTIGLAALTLAGAVGLAPAVQAADMTAKLTACPSDKTVIGGVNACGKIWKLGSGTATLGSDGTIKVELHGLVLNDASTGQFNGSPDGVDAVAVAVVCGTGADAKVAAQAEPVALSKTGDATISAKLAMPGACASPRVLVRERYEGKIGGWLAASGM
jgi:hypothetical protein